jgi:hypothetical protein
MGFAKIGGLLHDMSFISSSFRSAAHGPSTLLCACASFAHPVAAFERFGPRVYAARWAIVTTEHQKRVIGGESAVCVQSAC